MTVVSAAFVPMTPLLLRHLSGAADPVAELREAAVGAVRDVCAASGRVLVLCPVGGREAPGAWHDPTRPGSGGGSLAAQVAAHLLELAGVDLPTTYVEVTGPLSDAHALPGAGGTEGEQQDEVALLVLGDGAAARAQGAPGHIDHRSFAFDDEMAALIADGDGAGLAAMDRGLAAELLATGRFSWPVVGTLLPAAEGDLRWRGDPFGLTCLVAVWRV